MDLESAGYDQMLNSEAPWDQFDSHSYLDQNYWELRPDDRQLIELVRDFFSEKLGEAADLPVSGIDVGSGTNLYPAFSMLPWCEEITLYERSERNVAWLEEQVKAYDHNWDIFWQVFCEKAPYAAIGDPRAALADRVAVRQGDLFELNGKYGLGTMFFVAESLSASHEEFGRAVKYFMGALGPGAPFAAAFMEMSQGYQVGSQLFPACPVTQDQVERALDPYVAGGLRMERLGLPEDPIRSGYTGMILACGIRA